MTHPLAIYIDAAKLSQAQFARQLGISRSHLSELISKAKTPSLKLAFDIERATAGAVPASSWVPAVTPDDASAEDAA